MNIFKKMHYKSKLILCYMVLVSLPLALSIILLYNSIIKPVQDNAMKSIENRMEQELHSIDSQMDKLDKVAYLLSTNTTLNRFFTPQYYDDLTIIKAMNNDISPLMSWLEASNPDIFQYHFFTENSSIPETSFFHQYSSFAEDEWVRNMQEGIALSGHYWESAHPGRSYRRFGNNYGQTVYSLFYPLLTSGNYLEISVLPSVFFENLEALPVLNSGFLVASTLDGTLISGNVPSEFIPALEKFLTDTNWKADSEKPYAATIDGDSYFICHRTIPELETRIIAIVPSIDILEPLERSRQYFILSILAAITGTVLLSLILSSILIRRINRMTEGVQKIQEGNFHVCLPVDGNDEIDQLASAINYMAVRIDDLINSVYKAQVLQKETELAAMQAQIDPHFLFNILDTFKMIAVINDLDDFSDSIAALGSLMRYNISSASDRRTLRQEIKILQDYINIQNLLLNDRVSLLLSVPDKLLDFEIPSFILQPIAENSFVHGFHNKLDKLILKVTVGLRNTCVEIRIEDNGTGISDEQKQKLYESMEEAANSIRIAPKGSSIGLANVYLRLYLHYGNTVSLKLSSSSLGGACVTLLLPQTPGFLPDATESTYEG